MVIWFILKIDYIHTYKYRHRNNNRFIFQLDNNIKIFIYIHQFRKWKQLPIISYQLSIINRQFPNCANNYIHIHIHIQKHQHKQKHKHIHKQHRHKPHSATRNGERTTSIWTHAKRQKLFRRAQEATHRATAKRHEFIRQKHKRGAERHQRREKGDGRKHIQIVPAPGKKRICNNRNASKHAGMRIRSFFKMTISSFR